MSVDDRPPFLGLRSVTPETLPDAVVGEVRRAIETWVYQPGETLPSERAMADVLQVSRNTVRMALAQLEWEGMLVVRRGRGGGYEVRDPSLIPNLARQVRANPAKYRALWDYMQILNSNVAALAAIRRNAGDIEVLEQVMGNLNRARIAYQGSQALLEARAWQAYDLRFYIALAQAGKNDYLLNAVLNVRRELWSAFSTFLVSIDQGNQERRQKILNAIVAQEPEEARKLMHDHVELGRAWLDSWFHPDSDDAAPPPESHGTHVGEMRYT